MLKQYLMEAGFWIITVVGPILLVWFGRFVARMMESWGSRVADAAGALIDHLVEKSKSALVDRGLIELKNLIADPAQSSRIEKLRAALAAECKRTEAPFALEP